MVDSRNNIYVYRGIYHKHSIYIDKDAKTKLTIDYTNYLSTDAIASMAYEIEDSSTALQISDSSIASPIATLYVTATDYGTTPIKIKANMTSDATVAEVCSRSFTVHRART